MIDIILSSLLQTTLTKALRIALAIQQMQTHYCLCSLLGLPMGIPYGNSLWESPMGILYGNFLWAMLM